MCRVAADNFFTSNTAWNLLSSFEAKNIFVCGQLHFGYYLQLLASIYLQE